MTKHGWIVGALLLLTPVSGGLCVEFLQRCRYDGMVQKINASLVQFQNDAYANRPHRELDRFHVEGSPLLETGDWRSRSHPWALCCNIDPHACRGRRLSLTLFLTQERRIFLQKPTLTVFWSLRPPAEYQRALDHAFADLEYSVHVGQATTGWIGG